MHIIIVGGGPGGLMCAHSLLSKQIQVTLIEKRSKEDLFGDVGGAYDISSSTVKICQQAGLGEKIQRVGGKMNQFQMINGATGNLFKTIQLEDESFFSVRRSEIQRLFYDEIPEEVILCGRSVTDFQSTEQAVKVILDDGQEIEGDILIGADGIRSAILKSLSPKEFKEKIRFAGCICYWGFVKIPDLLQEGHSFSIQSPGKLVFLGNHGGTILWAAMCGQDAPDHSKSNEPEKVKEELLEVFKDSKGNNIQQILEETKMENISRVHVYDRDPLDKWFKGRCVLIGDAAHAMNPFAGQGANMAIIDGYLIASMIATKIEQAKDQPITTSDLECLWEKFESIRKLPATDNLSQARRDCSLAMGGSVWKDFLIRNIVRFTPGGLMKYYLLKADQQNHPALAHCNISLT